MKKSYYAMAAALMMLSSCSSQEEPSMAQDTESTAITVSVVIPNNGAMSRVTEDDANIPGKGAKISRVEYAIYDNLGTCVLHSTSTPNPDVEIKDIDDHGHYTLKVQLLKQHTYTFYLWASAEGSPYTFNPLTKQVSVDYSKVRANDESMDAFFGKKQFTIADEQTSTDQYTVILNRPFAQLNIMINDKDKAALDADVHISGIDVAVKQAPGRYSLLNLDNFVAGNGGTEVVFSAEFPNGWQDLVHAGDGDVAKYYYLATCYLLTGSNPDGSLNGLVGAAKETTDIVITMKYSDGSTIVLNKTAVPIRRSWRTNIYGSLETADVDVNCRIDFNFDGGYKDGPGADNESSGPDDGDHSGDDNSNNETID